CEIDKRGAFCVTREHQGLPFEILTPLRSYGRTPTGQVAQQRVCVVDAHGHKHIFRRLRMYLAPCGRTVSVHHVPGSLPPHPQTRSPVSASCSMGFSPSPFARASGGIARRGPYPPRLISCSSL